MFYFFIIIFLLLMSDHFKTQLLWYFTKLTTKIELWSKKKNKDEFSIIRIYKINNMKNEEVNKKNYLFHKNKLTINCNNNEQNFLIKFLFKNYIFKIILTNSELKNFEFNFDKVNEPRYLSVLGDENQDITDIINQYSGPERNFYINKINFNLEKIYGDLDFKIKSKKFKIIDNKANEKDIINIKNLVN